MLARYGISDIDMILTNAQKGSAVHALNTAYMAVLQATAENRKTLSSFYDATLDGRSRVALVDIGWVGNIQRCFLHSLSDPSASARVSGITWGCIATISG